MRWLEPNAPVPSTLGGRQELFTECVAKLIEYALGSGYTIRLGEVQRDPRVAALNAAKGTGISSSLHIDKLAVDAQLFKNGVYLTRTEDYAALGAYWKSLHPLACWGGDFKGVQPDGNHFSITWQGRK